MAFDIRKYIEENKIELGSIKKEVGDSAFKGGHNDLRKTQYDVKLTEDGKLDLYTHKEVVTEGKKKQVNEALTKKTVALSPIFGAAQRINQIKGYMHDEIMKRDEDAAFKYLDELKYQAELLIKSIKNVEKDTPKHAPKQFKGRGGVNLIKK